jgi:VWFA-related protein
VKASTLLAMRTIALALGAALLPAQAHGRTTEQNPARTQPSSPDSSVRILSPRASNVAYGPTTIRVRVVAPEGIRTSRVDFVVDGRLIGLDPLAPYEREWDAGKDLGSHVIRAIARFSDGTSAEDALFTRGLAWVQHELVLAPAIERVELLVSVTNAVGAPVRGLRLPDFEIREEQAAVPISEVRELDATGDVPLSVAVLVDRSGSMRSQMKQWGEACVSLLSSLRPIDQIRVSAFSSDTTVLQDFTHDAASLRASLEQIGQAGGDTRLFRAVYQTVRDMRDLPGRKALILLTDGLDTEFTTASGPVTANMYAMLSDTLRMASRAGVTVFLVLPGPSGRGYLAVQDLALQTGGSWMYPSEDLRALMRRLGERLLSSYVVVYEVPRPANADKKRALKVSVRSPEGQAFEVHAALGAYARSGGMDTLRDDLENGNTAQRARAAREIGLFPGDEVTRLLMKALGDTDPEVRAAVLLVLGRRKDVQALDKVMKRAHDADARVRAAAYAAAVEYGGAALPFLEENARPGRHDREMPLRALGLTGDPRAAASLTVALGDPDCGLRTAAADAAGSLLLVSRQEATDAASAAGDGAAGHGAAGHGAAVGLLRERLRATMGDACRGASEAASIALGRLVDPSALKSLLAAADAPDSPRTPEVLEALGYYPDASSMESIEKRLSAADPIGGAARKAASEIYAASLEEGAPLPREAALDRLVLLGGDEAAEAIRRALVLENGRKEPAPLWRGRLQEALNEVWNASRTIKGTGSRGD